MPVRNNIELSSGKLYYIGVDESLHPIGDISETEIETETEWADDRPPLKTQSVDEATFECDLQINQEWTLVYCRNCRSPFPIIQFDALIYGRDGWTCPLCAVIARARGR